VNNKIASRAGGFQVWSKRWVENQKIRMGGLIRTEMAMLKINIKKGEIKI